MSARERVIARALARLSAPQAVLAPASGGAGFGVFSSADRRRRPVARLSAPEVRALAADGAIASQNDGDSFVLTQAGRARVRRDAAAPEETYAAQHGAIVPRAVMDANGVTRSVRGFDSASALKRLATLRDTNGAPWLSGEEMNAAARLADDWRIGQAGLVHGSDWSAPLRGASPRGPGNAREGALALHCDARQRVSDALASLAAPLRRVVERVCLYEDGLEALERQEGWPARSGKIALKLGLAQLAAGSVYARR